MLRFLQGRGAAGADRPGWRRRPVATRSLALVFAIAVSGCATATREPANLYPLKQQIRSYVESGQYEKDIAAVSARASAWLEQRARPGARRLTMVFDLDETLFKNWPQISQQDFGYVTAEWDRWVQSASAPPVEPVRELYRAARRLGIDVVYITGRPERERAATERNLRAIDCADYAVLICRPPGLKGSSAVYKTEQRRRLAGEGRTIIANIGDQQSDLDGGFAERVFKLPNPFYFTE